MYGRNYNSPEGRFHVDSSAVSQLLALIRSSLWQKPVEVSSFEGQTVEWDAVGKISIQQTVGGLAFKAGLELPEELRPPKTWLIKAISFLERNRLTHLLVDRIAAEASAKLNESGITPVLLKGQAYARMYPDYTLRQCGDIDFYVGEENYRQAYLATRRIGWESEERFNPVAKHYGCNSGGVRIELHRIAGSLPFSSADRRFQKWSLDQINSGRKIEIGGNEIMIPTPLFDVVFVFMHAYLHFISGGIGLRHICDWTMLLHAHSGEIDSGKLEGILEEFRLLRGWRLFSPLAVQCLGLPKEECPLFSPEYGREARRILTFILKEGNFGRGITTVSPRPNNYLARKASSFRTASFRFYKKLWIDPDMVSFYYGNYVKGGVRNVIKDFFA